MEYFENKSDFKIVNSDFIVELSYLRDKLYYTKVQWFNDEDTDEYVQWSREVRYDEPRKIYKVKLIGVKGFDLNDYVIDSYGNKFVVIGNTLEGQVETIDTSDIKIGGDFTKVGSVFSK